MLKDDDAIHGVDHLVHTEPDQRSVTRIDVAIRIGTVGDPVPELQLREVELEGVLVQAWSLGDSLLPVLPLCLLRDGLFVLSFFQPSDLG